MRTHFLFFLLSFFVLFPKASYASTTFWGGVDSQYLSNTYLDASRQWDVMTRPFVNLEFGFVDNQAAGYLGATEIFVRHTDLFYHEHELYWLLNPSFGSEDQHQFYLGLSLAAQKNSETYKVVDVLSPKTELSLSVAPNDWLFWKTTVTSQYRWYPNRANSDSVDTWAGWVFTFSAPTRTSFSPRVDFGYRHYIDPEALPMEPYDFQLKLGARLAQGVGEYSGIWVDYEYVKSFDDNNMVLQELANVELNLLDDEFLFSAHRVLFGGRRMWDAVQLDVEVGYEARTYNGFDVLDVDGLSTGVSRQDDHIWARIGVDATRDIEEESLTQLNAGVSYEFLRQFSNDVWFDTDSHLVMISLSIDR